MTSPEQAQRYILDAPVNRRTIFVDTTGVAVTAFGIDAGTRQRLFDNGRAAAEKFLATALPATPEART